MAGDRQEELEFESEDRPELSGEQAEQLADMIRNGAEARKALQEDRDNPEKLEERLRRIRERIAGSDAEVNESVSRARQEETSEKVKDTLGTVDAQMDQEASAQAEHDRIAADIRRQNAVARRPQQEINRRGRARVNEELRKARERGNEHPEAS